MLAKVHGQWAFVSKRTRRPLAYWRGRGHPPKWWVDQQERRVQYFKRNPDEVTPYGKPGSWTGLDAVVMIGSLGAVGYGITQYKPGGDQENNKLATSALALGGLTGLLLLVTKASNALEPSR